MSDELTWGLIGSAVIAYILPKISSQIDSFFSYIVTLLFKVVPTTIKNYLKSRRLKKLLNIRKLRYNQDAVMFQSIKAHSYFILFWCVVGFYLLLLIIGPLKTVPEKSILFTLFLTSPIYIFELLWLRETAKAQILIKNRGRITKKLKGTVATRQPLI